MDRCMSMKKKYSGRTKKKKKREMDGCMSMKKNIVDGQKKKEKEKWTDACP